MRCPRCDREFHQHGYLFCPFDGAQMHGSARAIAVSETAIEGALLGDRYRVRGFFAKGAMARIYLADDEETGAIVAVKMMQRRFAQNDEVRERFLREATAIRQIQHESIVRIHHVGLTDDERPFMVMDFLVGESLGDHLRRKGTMTRDAALRTLSCSAEALWAAHQLGIVHRDVKPDNIYLVGEGEGDRAVRLLDFGLSRVWRSELTKSGSVIGTPSYMAPEQACADPTDQRTDVYALGLVMYRMLAGRAPFMAEDERTMVAQQLLSQPPLPSKFASEIDAQLELVIMTAINKRPEERYPSMQLMGRDLSQLAKSPVGKASLWARARSDASYPLDSPSAKFAAKAFKDLVG